MPTSTSDEEEADLAFKNFQKSKATQAAAKPVPTKKQSAARDYVGFAESDFPAIAAIQGKLQKAADKFQIPLELLAGIASRETGGGRGLDANGYAPDGHGFGDMQIDNRYHKPAGKKHDSQEHYDQAAGILRANRNEMDRRFPRAKDEQRWLGAIAAYNKGLGKIKDLRNVDAGTTGNDYATDVISRSSVFRDRMIAKSQGQP